MVYDGNGNLREVIAFEPTQIKSATDNIGTFDSGNPDIRYSLSPADDIGSVRGGIYGKDIALKRESLRDIGPVRADIAPVASTAEIGPVVNQTAPTDEIGPLPEGYTEQTAGEQDRVTEQKAAPSTVRERLERKIENTQAELDKNRQFRDEALKDYDEEIARAQAELDAKKNKDTKAAQGLRRRIERLNRFKADIDADYSKRKKCADAKPSAH